MRVNNPVGVSATAPVAAPKETAKPSQASSTTATKSTYTLENTESASVSRQRELTSPERRRGLLQIIRNSPITQGFRALNLSIFNRSTSTATPSAATPSAATPSAATPSAATPSAATPSAITPSAITPSATTPSATTPSPPPVVESFYLLPPDSPAVPPSPATPLPAAPTPVAANPAADQQPFLYVDNINVHAPAAPANPEADQQPFLYVDNINVHAPAPANPAPTTPAPTDHSEIVPQEMHPHHVKIESSRERVTHGIAKVHEEVFQHHGEHNKTTFFSTEGAQALNAVHFSDGKAQNTLLKAFENLDQQIENTRNRLRQAPPAEKEALKEELHNLRQLKKEFTQDYKVLRDAYVEVEKLEKANASPEHIQNAKQAIQTAQTKIESHLGLLNSDIAYDMRTAKKIGSSLQNRMIFVMSPSGEFYAMDQTRRDVKLPDGHRIIADAKIHHSSMLDSEAVGGAGELRVGSQLNALGHELSFQDSQDISGAGRKITGTSAKAAQKRGEAILTKKAEIESRIESEFQSSMQTIQNNANTSLERRFLEEYKAIQLKNINNELDGLDASQVENHAKISELNHKRTDLLNETFVLDAPSEQRSDFLAYRAEHFNQFKADTLPQILHNIIESQFPEGQVEILSDQSGHYRPDLSKTGQTISQLEKQGVETERLTVTVGEKDIQPDRASKDTIKNLHPELNKSQVKKKFNETLDLPAAAVQELTKAGKTEADLRQMHWQRQALGQEIAQRAQQKAAAAAPPPPPVQNESDYEQTFDLGQPSPAAARPTLVQDESGYMQNVDLSQPPTRAG
ncbi:MAG: hypothetical protein AB7I41_19885 [Candidatus Sericytochromatia bacterium]